MATSDGLIRSDSSIDWRCILRFLIYSFSFFSIMMAVACFFVESHDELPQGSSKEWRISINYLLMMLMIIAIIPLILHYFEPRLLLINIHFITSICFYVCRINLAFRFHFEFIFTLILLNTLAAYYFYFVFKQMKQTSLILRIQSVETQDCLMQPKRLKTIESGEGRKRKPLRLSLEDA